MAARARALNLSKKLRKNIFLGLHYHGMMTHTAGENELLFTTTFQLFLFSAPGELFGLYTTPDPHNSPTSNFSSQGEKEQAEHKQDVIEAFGNYVLEPDDDVVGKGLPRLLDRDAVAWHRLAHCAASQIAGISTVASDLPHDQRTILCGPAER